PRLHPLCQLTLVEVAGHRLDPRRGDADEGLGEVVVGEADRLQHRARGGPVGAVGQRGAVALGGVGRTVVRVRRHGGLAYRAVTPSGPWAADRQVRVRLDDTPLEVGRAWWGCGREPSHRGVLGRAHISAQYERSLRPCAARFAAAQNTRGCGIDHLAAEAPQLATVTL